MASLGVPTRQHLALHGRLRAPRPIALVPAVARLWACLCTAPWVPDPLTFAPPHAHPRRQVAAAELAGLAEVASLQPRIAAMLLPCAIGQLAVGANSPSLAAGLGAVLAARFWAGVCGRPGRACARRVLAGSLGQCIGNGERSRCLSQAATLAADPLSHTPMDPVQEKTPVLSAQTPHAGWAPRAGGAHDPGPDQPPALSAHVRRTAAEPRRAPEHLEVVEGEPCAHVVGSNPIPC